MTRDSMTLWEKFQADCPWASRVPVFRYWAFGQWARGYDEHWAFRQEDHHG